jgi:hypothetical protein
MQNKYRRLLAAPSKLLKDAWSDAWFRVPEVVCKWRGGMGSGSGCVEVVWLERGGQCGHFGTRFVMIGAV